MKKNYTDYNSNKVYNYKTYSLDGTTVLHEVFVKYLFSFTQKAYSKVEQFYLNPKSYNNMVFPEDQKKDVNNRTCRWILCEEERITYDINGVEFSRTTKYERYDKSSSQYKNTPSHRSHIISNNSMRVLYTSDEVDDNDLHRIVLRKGGMIYWDKRNEKLTKKYALLNTRVFEGRPDVVAVKLINSMTIL